MNVDSPEEQQAAKHPHMLLSQFLLTRLVDRFGVVRDYLAYFIQAVIVDCVLSSQLGRKWADLAQVVQES